MAIPLAICMTSQCFSDECSDFPKYFYPYKQSFDEHSRVYAYLFNFSLVQISSGGIVKLKGNRF